MTKEITEGKKKSGTLTCICNENFKSLKKIGNWMKTVMKPLESEEITVESISYITVLIIKSLGRVLLLYVKILGST